MSGIWTPPVFREDVRGLRIQPIVNFSNEFHVVRKVGSRKESYIWDFVRVRKICPTKLVKLTEISTYHAYEHVNIFEPKFTIVLTQIPDEYLSRTVYFEIIFRSFQMDDTGLKGSNKAAAFNLGYHTGTTILYARR